MRASLSDQLKLKVRTLHGDIKASLATHGSIIIEPSILTTCGTSRATRGRMPPSVASKGGSIIIEPIDGEILFHRSVENSTTPSLEEVRRGRPSERILMTVRAFKHFCMNAPTEQGQAIRDYYITLEESVSEVLEGVRRGEISMAR